MTIGKPSGEDDNAAVARVLQTSLVHLLTLGLLATHARWNAIGTNFRSLRVELAELAEVTGHAADDVAERAVTIGAHADGRPSALTHVTAMPTIDPGAVGDTRTAKFVEAALDVVIDQLRTAIDMTADADAVSQAVLIGVSGELEKRAGRLRAWFAAAAGS
jgi:starvation-inducible DNA-binding protein